MDAIAEIKNRLGHHPKLRVSETPTSIEVSPPGPEGFPVALFVEPDGFLVHFAGWHEHFESVRAAVQCFSYGLLGDCRLRVTYRGRTAHRWTLEHRRDGQWIEEGSTRLFLFPFWRRPRTVLLRNRIERAP